MKVSYRKLIALVLALTMMTSIFAACGDKTEDVNLAEIYSLNVTSKELNVGVTDSLMVLDSSDGERTYETTWTSSDPSVVYVDTLGILTGLSAGTATVTATVTFDDLDDVLNLTCAVTVKNTSVALQGMHFKQEASTHNVGEVLLLDLTFDPLNATNKNYTLTSSNEAVASVTNNTVITVGEGTAIITATSEDGAFTDTYTVTVVVPKNNYESISLNKTSRTLTVGNSYTLKVTVKPEIDGVEPTVSWSSSDTSVATVDSNGKVKAVGAGTATITCSVFDTVSTHTATCKITVNKASSSSGDSGSSSSTVKATGVTFDKSTITARKSTTDVLKFVATVTPSNTTETGKWTSSDTSIASVDSKTGIITINKNLDLAQHPGNMATVVITYTIGSVSKTGVLVVTQDFDGNQSGSTDTVAPESITLSQSSVSLSVNGSTTLTATFAPSNTTNKAITWTSSNTAVATVVNGKITGVAAGTATITAKSSVDSKVFATCQVTVTSASSGAISVSPANATIAVGGSTKLTATLASGVAGTIFWSSSNNNVATVDSTGKVVGVSVGNAVITATCGAYTASCAVTVSTTGGSSTGSATSVKATINMTLGGIAIPSGSELEKGSTAFASIGFDKTIPAADLQYFRYYMTTADVGVVSIESAANTNLFTISGLSEGTAKILIQVVDLQNKYTINFDATAYIMVVDPSITSSITHPASAITLSNYNLNISKDGNATITAAMTPATGTSASDLNDQIVWSSSDTNVAMVPSQGTYLSNTTYTNTITGTGVGTCQIYAKLRSNNAVVASCYVKVTESTTVTGHTINMTPGSDYTLKINDPSVYTATFQLPDAAIAAGIVITPNTNAYGVATSAKISVPSTITRLTTYITVTSYSSAGAVPVIYNLIIKEVDTSVNVTIASTTNVTVTAGNTTKLDVGQKFFTVYGITPNWYINQELSDGTATLSSQTGTSVNLKATGKGKVYVYCEYADYRDVYVVTIESATSNANNFELGTAFNTVKAGETFSITFKSNTAVTGTVYWDANSSKFDFRESILMANENTVTNTFVFDGTVTKKTAYTIYAEFIPNDGSKSVTKTITIYVEP